MNSINYWFFYACKRPTFSTSVTYPIFFIFSNSRWAYIRIRIIICIKIFNINSSALLTFVSVCYTNSGIRLFFFFVLFTSPAVSSTLILTVIMAAQAKAMAFAKQALGVVQGVAGGAVGGAAGKYLHHH